jgi:hypothetical protein
MARTSYIEYGSFKLLMATSLGIANAIATQGISHYNSEHIYDL